MKQYLQLNLMQKLTNGLLVTQSKRLLTSIHKGTVTYHSKSYFYNVEIIS